LVHGAQLREGHGLIGSVTKGGTLTGAAFSCFAKEFMMRKLKLVPGKVSYSPMERKLFSYLARGKKLSSTVLLQRLYKDAVNKHFHARETMNASLTSLKKKLAFNRSPIVLCNSALSGPKPKEWWLEKRR
jgi:hypothetical protein